jgi:hypothetical protein
MMQSRPSPHSSVHNPALVQPIQLIIPGRTPEAPPSSTSWWIAGLVLAVLAVTAVLVRCRLKGRDPLQRAFARISDRLGLTQAERARVRQVAGDVPPVALLLSDSALQRAAGDCSDDPLIVAVRAKSRNVTT